MNNELIRLGEFSKDHQVFIHYAGTGYLGVKLLADGEGRQQVQVEIVWGDKSMIGEKMYVRADHLCLTSLTVEQLVRAAAGRPDPQAPVHDPLYDILDKAGYQPRRIDPPGSWPDDPAFPGGQ